jgi:hypothetical protein
MEMKVATGQSENTLDKASAEKFQTPLKEKRKEAMLKGMEKIQARRADIAKRRRVSGQAASLE